MFHETYLGACLKLERLLRALVSVASILILVACPETLQKGFQKAWTRLALAWATGLDRKSRLLAVLDRFSVATDRLTEGLQGAIAKYVFLFSA